jgi:hypothetical protein
VEIAELVGVRLGGGHDLLAQAGELHRMLDSAADQELAVQVLLQFADLQGHRARIEVRVAGEGCQGGIAGSFQEAAQTPLAAFGPCRRPQENREAGQPRCRGGGCPGPSPVIPSHGRPCGSRPALAAAPRLFTASLPAGAAVTDVRTSRGRWQHLNSTAALLWHRLAQGAEVEVDQGVTGRRPGAVTGRLWSGLNRRHRA